MSRHPNEKPFEINRGTKPKNCAHTPSRKKKALRAEIELLTRDFEANGGKVQELKADKIESHWKPAFNWNPNFEDYDHEHIG